MGRWASIEHRKGSQDKKRGKLFTKLIREIGLAARLGGGDPGSNPRLRRAMDEALGATMTKDTILRAIARGTGAEGGAQLEEIRYEGYAAGGVAVIVDCLTDNSTRTVADVRHAFTKAGAQLGTSGSVAFQFSETGQIALDTRNAPGLEDRILEIALEAGADDVVSEDGYTEVLTAPAQFEAVRAALQGAGLEPIEAGVVMRPATRVALQGEQAESLVKLLHRLEELDDVQEVHHNADLPEAVLHSA